MLLNNLEKTSCFIKNMPSNSLAFFTAEISTTLNKQKFFYNPQGANCYFQYLLGYEAENIMQLLIHKTDEKSTEKILFCQDPVDNKKGNFSYIYKDINYYKETYKDFICRPLSEFYETFYKLGLKSRTIFYPGWKKEELPDFLFELLIKWSIDGDIRMPKKRIISYRKLLDKNRMIKTKDEIINMSKASKITEEAFKNILMNWDNFLYELDVSAQLRSMFFKDKFSFPAYEPIVSVDSNGLSLHHHGNMTSLKNKNMVIIDAAASYKGYAVDVTRTYIISKDIQQEYIEIYEIVLFCQETILNLLRPGITFDKLQELAYDLLLTKLEQFNILEKLPILKTISNSDFIKIVFPHKIGHWIGLEVHDVGTYNNTSIPNSSTLTIEPGLYFPKDKALFGPYAGICVRIEDTVVVTEEGVVNLTDNIPKNRNFL